LELDKGAKRNLLKNIIKIYMFLQKYPFFSQNSSFFNNFTIFLL
jgi:hypothetical protein